MTKTLLLKAKNAGRIDAIEFPETEDHLDFYYETIGCSCIDIVRTMGLEDIGMKGYDLIVDDEGLIVGKDVNPIASILYGCDIHGQPIVGDALLCKRVETPEGLDSTGMTDEELHSLLTAFNLLIAKHNAKVGSDKGK